MSETRTRVLTMARRLGGWFAVPVLYGLLREALAMGTEHDGLLTPDGSVSVGIALLAFVVLLLRVASLFVVPAALVYRLVAGWRDDASASRPRDPER